MNKYIIFISGLSGTGKSTLKKYFDDNPINGYRFYDFDKGDFPCPPDEKDHYEWRTKQTEAWLQTGISNLGENFGTMIFGLCSDPERIIEMASSKSFDPAKIKFAYLFTETEERKNRLFGRGTPRHWQGEKPWYKQFYAALKSVNAKKIDTTNKSVNEIAKEFINWLEKI